MKWLLGLVCVLMCSQAVAEDWRNGTVREGLQLARSERPISELAILARAYNEGQAALYIKNAQLAQRMLQNNANATQGGDTLLRRLTADVIPNYDQFIYSTQWQGFLNSNVPGGGGVTYRSIAASYAQSGDMNALAQMMRSVATSQRNVKKSR